MPIDKRFLKILCPNHLLSSCFDWDIEQTCTAEYKVLRESRSAGGVATPEFVLDMHISAYYSLSAILRPQGEWMRLAGRSKTNRARNCVRCGVDTLSEL
jgi:hypothetical protein